MFIAMAVLTRLPSSRLGCTFSAIAVYRLTFFVPVARCSVLIPREACAMAKFTHYIIPAPVFAKLAVITGGADAETAFTMVIVMAILTRLSSSLWGRTSSIIAVIRLASLVPLATCSVPKLWVANPRGITTGTVTSRQAICTTSGLTLIVMVAVLTSLPFSILWCASLYALSSRCKYRLLLVRLNAVFRLAVLVLVARLSAHTLFAAHAIFFHTPKLDEPSRTPLLPSTAVVAVIIEVIAEAKTLTKGIAMTVVTILSQSFPPGTPHSISAIA
jgi:hypothetical protein